MDCENLGYVALLCSFFVFIAAGQMSAFPASHWDWYTAAHEELWKAPGDFLPNMTRGSIACCGGFLIDE
jgi:hypothetical protein